MLLLDRSGSSEWCLCASLSPPPPSFTSLHSLFARSLWADSCIAAVEFTDVQLYSDCALTSTFQPPPPLPVTANLVIIPNHPPGDESIVNPDQSSDFLYVYDLQ